jgi:hypothetical protein
MEASATAITVEISAMPIEFSSARVKMCCWKMPL